VSYRQFPRPTSRHFTVFLARILYPYLCIQNVAVVNFIFPPYPSASVHGRRYVLSIQVTLSVHSKHSSKSTLLTVSIAHNKTFSFTRALCTTIRKIWCDGDRNFRASLYDLPIACNQGRHYPFKEDGNLRDFSPQAAKTLGGIIAAGAISVSLNRPYAYTRIAISSRGLFT
jgi:hypothetical protein